MDGWDMATRLTGNEAELADRNGSPTVYKNPPR
jgi:hypothetical protein